MKGLVIKTFLPTFIFTYYILHQLIFAMSKQNKNKKEKNTQNAGALNPQVFI